MRLPAAILVPAALFLLVVPKASADVTVSIDLDTSTSGIQNSIDVTAGSTITGAIVLNVTGATRFSAYDFIMDFEQNHLGYGPNTLMGFTSDSQGNRNVPIETNRVNIGASGIISISPVVVFDLGPLTDDDPLSAPSPDLDPIFNSFSGIAAGTSGTRLGTDASGTYTATIYEFTLTALSEGTGALALRGAENTFLDATDLGTVNFGNGLVNITAVPEPSTLLACSLGFGLVVIRHRRSKNRKSPVT